MTSADGAETRDIDAYCRAIEAHLCRRNNGHLIRVSGPAFDMVRGWAERGIPLGVATAGIDRTVERHASRGRRHRPVHISFCEDDVLDAFDEWRRALGVPASGPEHAADGERERESKAHPASLPAHLERVVNRLTMMRAATAGDRELDDALDGAVRAIDGARAQARQARGDARAAIVVQLAALDESLVALVRCRLPEGRDVELLREADAELAAFRERMPADAYAAARTAAADRLLRRSCGLPVIRYEG